MKVWFQAGYLIFHLLVCAYAVALLIGAISVRAQPIQQFEITELERRITSIEALNLDHRLTIIETILNEINSQKIFDRLTMGGTGLLIAERVVNTLRKKKEL